MVDPIPVVVVPDPGSLARAFGDGSLPRPAWTHQAHLLVGLWHLHRYGGPQALMRMRTGIRRLNRGHGVANGPGSGYHETITRAYLTLLGAFVHLQGSRPLAAQAALLLAAPLAAPDLLGRFYSAPLLASALARRCWVAPDRAPLDVVGLTGADPGGGIGETGGSDPAGNVDE